MYNERRIYIETYDIDGDIITFTETIDPMGMGLQTYGSQFFFNDQYSYTQMELESDNDMMEGINSSIDIEHGVIYPAC